MKRKLEFQNAISKNINNNNNNNIHKLNKDVFTTSCSLNCCSKFAYRFSFSYSRGRESARLYYTVESKFDLWLLARAVSAGGYTLVCV